MHWGEGVGGTHIIYCIRGYSVRAQPKKGDLRCWHSAKKWGSQLRTQPERGWGCLVRLQTGIRDW